MATMNRSRPPGERGQAIVELALTLPLLLLVVLGIFDFGLMFSRFGIVTNAAREGARVAVLPDFIDPRQAERHAEAYLNFSGLPGAAVFTAGCGGALSPGRLCASAVPGTLTIPAIGGSPAKTVQLMVVTVTYDHAHVFVGPITQLFGGSLATTRLTAVSRMRKEGS